MCLITDQREPLIAENDIICYKFLKRNDKKSYSSVYRSMIWYFDKIATSIVIAEYNRRIYRHVVNSGLHAFLNPYETLYSFDGVTPRKDFWHLKMIIPKGSKYYISEYGTEIAANQMIMVGLVNWSTRLKIFLHNLK